MDQDQPTPAASPQPHEIETHLTRDLGLVSALAIGVGTMIAAGIFTLSGLAVGYVGSGAILSFLMAAVVATFTALTYCEFSSIYPESGEGYLYARKTFSPPMAYMVGWCLLLGYTSSCGFYVASLSAYVSEFILHPLMAPAAAEEHPGGEGGEQHADDTGEPVASPTPSGEQVRDADAAAEEGDHVVPKSLEQASGIVALVLLVLLNVRGTKESGNFQIVVTAGKVVLLMWFIGGGLMVLNWDYFVSQFPNPLDQVSPDGPLWLGKYASTAALVFITFFGFSAIAASAGEVVNPTKTIPRAIFISMGVVTVLYTLVVICVVIAQLDEYSEAAMGRAATLFLGPVGGYVIIAGALFSMISASNASIMAGSRVALSMAQLGHLPREVGTINAQTRTPVVALVLTGAAIGAFALVLELEKLANFANIVLLVALILVNIALILHRRRHPDMERPFRVPLVPLLPILGILANAYLLWQIRGETEPVVLAGFCLVVGFGGFLAWKGFEVPEIALPGQASRVALERNAPGADKAFRILVPVANPANVDRLIDMAAVVAKNQEAAEIIVLKVVIVPDQIAPSLEEAHVERERKLLDRARQRVADHGIPVSSIIRVGHNAARAILETARQRGASMVVLGWKGHTSTARRILGDVTDDVVNHARCDLMLVKLIDDDRPWKHLLLPTAGGEHARHAEQFATALAAMEAGSLTLCRVLDPDAPADRVTAEEASLAEAKARVEGYQVTGDGEQPSDGELVKTNLIRHRSVPVGIIKEVENYDAVVVGAASQSFSSQVLFGTIPENIARYSNKPVIVIKRHHAVKALVGRVLSE